MFNRVLYPTDFSEVSLHALRECIPRLAKLEIKELHLLNVVDITMAEFEAFELESVYREKLERLAREVEEECGGKTRIKADVRIGIPSIEIAKAAEEAGTELIVIPSVGENIWRRMFVGSTASNLVRAAKKPVLLIRYPQRDGKFEFSGDCERMFERPLVALDFSRCSVKLVQTVRKFRERVKGGILIHSVDYGGVDELEHNMAVAKKNLEKSTKGLGGMFEIEVMVGTASQAIIGTSLAKNSTLIVLGKKGRSFIKDLLLGSTAERVIRDSRLPVLLVPCE